MTSLADISSPIVGSVDQLRSAVDVPEVITDAVTDVAEYIADASVEGGRVAVAATRSVSRVVRRHPRSSVGILALAAAALVALVMWRRRADHASPATVTDIAAAA